MPWIAVASVAACTTERPFTVTLRGRPIAIFWQDPDFYAILNRCTHADKPLDGGTCLNGILECPFHGARFALKDGAVCAPPAVRPLTCFPTRVVDGQVEIALP